MIGASTLSLQAVLGCQGTEVSLYAGPCRRVDLPGRFGGLMGKENDMTKPHGVTAVAAASSANKSSSGRRDLTPALWRGFLGRCPNCRKGAMFTAYIRVAPRCPVCHEDLSPQRADDAPAYLTLVIVCHVIGAGVLFSDEILPNAPLIIAISFWLAATALMSILILPRMKGAVVGYQWALRMHGFGSPRGEQAF
jgi:uncharacterized protein (DUF983 family)